MKVPAYLFSKASLATSAILLALLAPTTVTAKTPRKPITQKTLPDAKREIAREIISCFHDDGPLAEGTAWDNVCYGNAAESFLELARHYAKQYLTNKDYSNDEDIADMVKTDQEYFESQVSSCEAFPSGIGAESRKQTWIQICRLHRAREYAEYFYRATDKEISSDPYYKESEKKFVNRIVGM